MASLSPEVRTWIASLIGREVAEAQELTGGASRTSFIVTDASGAKYFLRMDLGNGPLSGTRYTLAREHSVLRFLQNKDVPVARVFGYSSEHEAILMECVPGYTSYERTSPPEEEATLQRDLLAAIVKLQTVDPSGLAALSGSGLALGPAVAEDLAEWADLYRRNVTPPDPLLAFALNFLASGIPDAEIRPVIVHGDIGPGNFLIDHGRVRALIDWEMVRMGHPLEDLACIIARGLGARFGEARDHVACYEQLTRSRVDPRTLDYALVLVITRWTIAIAMALSQPTAAQNVPMLFAFRQINARALVGVFCRYYGLPEQEEAPAPEENAAARAAAIYSRDVLNQLAADPRLTGADRDKLEGIRDLVAYLKSFIDYGPDRYDAEEIARIATLTPPGDDPKRAICDHASGVVLSAAAPLVEYLRWRTTRENGLMRTSLRDRADTAIAF